MSQVKHKSRVCYSQVGRVTKWHLLTACLVMIFSSGCPWGVRSRIANLDGKTKYEHGTLVHIDLSRGRYAPMADSPGEGSVGCEPYLFDFQRPKDLGDADLLKTALPSTLTQLDLVGCAVGKATIEHIQRSCPNLERLDVSATDVTDECLRVLAGCKKLAALNMSGTRVTDEGMEHLQKLESLEEVFLVDTLVGVDGIRKLLTLPNIRTIHVFHSRVSKKDVERLEDDDAVKINFGNPYNSLVL